MAEFFIAKTGMHAYDLSRAYGLGLIVEAVGGNSTMTDYGSYFGISGDDPDPERRAPKMRRFLGTDLHWKEPLVTLGKVAAEKAVGNVQDELSDERTLSELLSIHRSLDASLPDAQDTLYHSMEPAAAKGIRDRVVGRSYSEGSQFKVPHEEWLLSILGHANVSTWVFGKDTRLCVIPSPKELPIRYIDDLRMQMRKARIINAAGTEVTVAEQSVRLYREALESKDDLFHGHAQFENMLFYSLSKTSTQWKPERSATYPLGLINHVFRCGDSGVALSILDVWEKVLRNGNRKGGESLALALTRAIKSSSLDCWRKYVSTHIRFAKRYDEFDVYYEKDALSEVFRWLKD